MHAILDTFGVETLLNYEYLNIYSTLAVFALLIIASYYDSRTFKIPNKLNMSFCILRLILIPFIGLNYGNVIGLLVGALIILIPAMIKLKPMGGDIKMMAVVGFYLGFQNVLILMIVSIVLSAIYYGIIYILKKEFKDIPLAPFIFSGFAIINIMGFITTQHFVLFV